MTEPVDPDRLEAVEFSVVRRGLDPAAVRSTLAEAADGLRLMKRRCHELEHRIETLESQVPDPDDLENERSAARTEGRAAGGAEAEQRLEAAREEAESLLAEAKEEGRLLVGEAQTVRRRMLEDLARRRRALRQQIEQLRGGRERLLEAYEVVGHTVHEATAELSVAMPEARAAAERAGHGVGPEETVEQLEAEIESARLAGLPIVAEEDLPGVRDDAPTTRRRPVAVPLERDVRDMPEVEPVVAEFEEVRVLTGLGADDSDVVVSPPADTAGAANEDDTASAELESDVPGVEPDRAVVEPDHAVVGPGSAEPDAADDGAAIAPADTNDVAGESAVTEVRAAHAAGDGEPEADGDVGGADPDAVTVVVDELDGEADREAEKEDLFARLRRSRAEAEVAAAASSDDEPMVPEAVERPEPEDGADDPAAEVEDAASVDVADEGTAAPDDPFDHPDDAAEPFGLVLGAEPDDESTPASASMARATAEHELARRLKRLLSDEQNDVLDRLRRTRKRSLVVDDLLDGFDERVTRFAEAVQPVLADAASTATAQSGAAAPPVDDLAAELAREVAEALADGLVEPLEEEVPVDEMGGSVRALYRRWKTDRIGALAERYVEAAYEPVPSAD